MALSTNRARSHFRPSPSIQTEFQIFLDTLGNALEPLSPACQLAYGLACCERHFQQHVAFHQEEQWGNPAVLRQAIDTGWELATGEQIVPVAQELLAECMSSIPHSDQFSTPSADYAQNAAIMVAHVVEFMIRNDVKYIVMTATLARDLVDARVQITENLDPSDSRLEWKIADHPLMQAELRCQIETLDVLKGIRDSAGLKVFRKSVASGSIS